MYLKEQNQMHRWAGLLLLGLCLQSSGLAAGITGLTGSISGTFNNVQFAGQYINQTAGANAQTPPNYNFVNRDNTATAVTAGIGTSDFTWGSCNGCMLGAGVSPFSEIQWLPVAFNNQAPNVDFLLGKIQYTNGTINLSTGTYGATLNLAGNMVTDQNGAGVALVPLAAPYTNWDTVNLNTGAAFNNQAVKGLAGNNVVNAAGQLFDNAGNPILDSMGNQAIVPGPNYYNTFWSADYISFQPGIPFANFQNGVNDAGTFEGQKAVFDVIGKIVGDPMIEIDSIVLDDSALGSGFADSNAEEEASTPEPASFTLIGAGLLLGAGLSMRRNRRA
jgi:hypothetical protein